ncbi:MAG TPA: hypothetical protein VLY04_17880 [Bryobacteraceae bacterium]|nr:hypothetical protein [Bryobacteraceae bacterium]
MEMILLDANGLRMDAVLLAAARDRIRVAFRNRKDTVELLRDGDRWISENGKTFEFEAWIAGSFPGEETLCDALSQRAFAA